MQYSWRLFHLCDSTTNDKHMFVKMKLIKKQGKKIIKRSNTNRPHKPGNIAEVKATRKWLTQFDKATKHSYISTFVSTEKTIKCANLKRKIYVLSTYQNICVLLRMTLEGYRMSQGHRIVQGHRMIQGHRKVKVIFSSSSSSFWNFATFTQITQITQHKL